MATNNALNNNLASGTGLPLTTGVTGTLPVANGGTGVTSSTGTGSVVLSTSPTVTGLTSDQITWSDTTKGIVGTTTNNDASAGYVGEYQSIYNSTGVVAVASVAGNVTSISLPAGDWDVYGQCVCTPNSGQVVTLFYSSITTVSATIVLAAFGTASWLGNNFIGDGSSGLALVPTLRLSLSGATTVYLAYYSTVGSTIQGGIWARRAR